MPQSVWFSEAALAPDDPAWRLFCFPFAGGGAGAFAAWQRCMSSPLSVVSLCPPGRETRMADPAITEFPAMIPQIADAIEPWLDRPTAFFGHSLGALVAYELACELRQRQQPLPQRLILSACTAPQLRGRPSRLHELPDDQFLAVVAARYGGIPQALLEQEELRRLFAPILKSDFALLASYQHRPRPPLPCELTLCTASEDQQIPPEGVAGWAEHFAGSVTPRTYRGDHFYLTSCRQQLLDDLQADLLGS